MTEVHFSVLFKMSDFFHHHLIATFNSSHSVKHSAGHHPGLRNDVCCVVENLLQSFTIAWGSWRCRSI